jgi:hypothetical protein
MAIRVLLMQQSHHCCDGKLKTDNNGIKRTDFVKNESVF